MRPEELDAVHIPDLISLLEPIIPPLPPDPPA